MNSAATAEFEQSASDPEFTPRSASPNPCLPPRGKGEHEVQRKPFFRSSPLYLLTSWVPHTEFSVWPLTEVDGSPSSITPAPPAPCRRRKPNNPKMRIRRHKNFSRAPLQSSSSFMEFGERESEGGAVVRTLLPLKDSDQLSLPLHSGKVQNLSPNREANA